MALATQPGIAVNANIMCQTNMISLREKYFPQIDKAPASQPAVTWQKVFLCHEQCLKCSETNLRWQYMYVGGLICQKTVDWSHFGSSEVIQRFCPRSQRVVATVCLFVKSGVKWHLLTNRQTVTLSRLVAWIRSAQTKGGVYLTPLKKTMTLSFLLKQSSKHRKWTHIGKSGILAYLRPAPMK